MTPIQRTLAMLRKQGYKAEVVERWIPYVKLRKDLFGFIDILAIGTGAIIGVQVTTPAHFAERLTKIKTECRENALAWLEAGGRIELWAWRKPARSRFWEPRIMLVRKEDLAI